MASKRILKKQTEELLKSLEEKAPLSTNPGRYECKKYKKPTGKVRRHSGRVTPRWASPGKYSEAIQEGVEPEIYWNDWQDYRDGLRWDDDPTHIRTPLRGYNQNQFEPEIVQANEKLKKQLAIRKAMLQKDHDKNITKLVRKSRRRNKKNYP